jgi:hypothetical protein
MEDNIDEWDISYYDEFEKSRIMKKIEKSERREYIKNKLDIIEIKLNSLIEKIEKWIPDPTENKKD